MTAARSNVRGVLGAILPQDERVLGELSQRAWIAGRDGSVAQSGGTGGSSLCPWTGATIASGGICSAFVGVPGIGTLRLFHAQGARTNLFLNSNAPATQNVTVGTGSVTISAVGSGYTLTTSAGTATGSGFGAVTMGTPQVLTVSGAGTITLTVSGTPVGGYVNVEQAAFAGIKVITAGSTVTRTADNIVWTPPSALSTTAGELYAFAVPYAWSSAAGAAIPQGANTRMWYSTAGVNTGGINGANGRPTAFRADAGTQSVTGTNLAWSSGTGVLHSEKWDSDSLDLFIGGVLNGTPDTTLSPPWTSISAVHIGNDPTVAGNFFGSVGLIYDPSPSDTTRAALARALNGRIVSVLG